MQEEIKEILDRLERIDHKEYIAFEFADSATFDETARCFEERKKMADYITNLQEELKLSHQDNLELLDYKSRNEKAIEYIDKNKQLSMFADLRKDGVHNYDLECDADDLLDILNGVDKE